MHEVDGKTKIDFSGLPKIILVGNPNVGKSVIFGFLTGKYVTVSNYPGTTVEISRGFGKFSGQKIGIIDAPGLNALLPSSEDEKVASDLILQEEPMALLQVADAKNLLRTLLLTFQLIETGLPLLLDLNLMDELSARGITLDAARLAKLLDLPVVETVAVEGKGLLELKKKILSPKISGFRVSYGEIIEEGLSKINALFPKNFVLSRARALLFLSGDRHIETWLAEKFGHALLIAAQAQREKIQKRFAQPLDLIIAKIRRKNAATIMREVMHTEADKTKATLSAWLQKFGALTLHPFWGMPILGLILFAMYKFVGEFAAQTGVGFIEETVFGGFLNPWIIRMVQAVVPYQIVRDFLVGEYGLFTMAMTYALAIVLPIVTAFFIFFSVLEDSGYLPRLAVLINRTFKLIGLSGKAVIPMVLGLGCDTMATMTTRTLETQRERVIATLLLALAIPCSAQLGVILGMLGKVSLAATLIWLGVVLGILLAVGFLASKIIPGQSAEFILEIPPLRLPRLTNILVKTLARLEWYLKEAIPLFMAGTAMLFVLDRAGTLKMLENFASPLVVGLLGLPSHAAEAFLVGFFRRDYGAAGLFAMASHGELSANQIVVSLVTITLFVPCVAQFFVMLKERGAKTTFWITAFIFPFAFLVGTILNFALKIWKITL